MTNPPMYGWYCEPEYHYTCVTHANSTKIYREKFTPKDKDYQVRLSNTDCLGVGRDVLLISFDCPKEALDYALNESRSISNRNRKTTKIYVKAKNT